MEPLEKLKPGTNGVAGFKLQKEPTGKRYDRDKFLINSYNESHQRARMKDMTVNQKVKELVRRFISEMIKFFV